MPVSAHTAARIHGRSGPTRRPHASSNRPGGTKRYATRATAPSSTPIRTESTPSRTPCLNAPSRRRRFKRYARTTESALPRTQTPIFRNAPSTATSKAVSTRRGQCPRTPAHRAVLAPSTPYRPNAPSRPRPASGTPPGIPPRRPSPDRRRVWRAANLPVPAECNGPGNLPGTHRVKAVRKTRRHAASDGRPR